MDHQIQNVLFLFRKNDTSSWLIYSAFLFFFFSPALCGRFLCFQSRNVVFASYPPITSTLEAAPTLRWHYKLPWTWQFVIKSNKKSEGEPFFCDIGQRRKMLFFFFTQIFFPMLKDDPSKFSAAWILFHNFLFYLLNFVSMYFVQIALLTR